MVVQIRKTPPPRITAWASLSAPMRLVGTEGVEPSRIAPQVPKTCASVISPRPRGHSHCSIAAGGLQASRRFPNAGLRAKSLFERVVWRNEVPPRIFFLAGRGDIRGRNRPKRGISGEANPPPNPLSTQLLRSLRGAERQLGAETFPEADRPIRPTTDLTPGRKDILL